jgi:hypothetical protein
LVNVNYFSVQILIYQSHPPVFGLFLFIYLLDNSYILFVVIPVILSRSSSSYNLPEDLGGGGGTPYDVFRNFLPTSLALFISLHFHDKAKSHLGRTTQVNM